MVTTESLCAKILEKYQIRDGISKKVADTVDGISFEDQIEIIARMQQVVDEFDGTS